MQYSIEVEVERPREKVWQFYNDAGRTKSWMPGILDRIQLEKNPAEVGSRARLIVKRGTGTMEMIETITDAKEPEFLAGTYTAPGVINHIKVYFVAKSSEVTLMRVESEFFFKGFVKFLAPVLKGVFIKQTTQDYQRLKSAIEAFK